MVTEENNFSGKVEREAETEVGEMEGASEERLVRVTVTGPTARMLHRSEPAETAGRCRTEKGTGETED